MYRMSDTWIDATQEYGIEGGGGGGDTTIVNISNDDLLTPPTNTDANNLIKLVDVAGTNHLYLLQSNPEGEIRFLTLDAKNNNNQGGQLLYNTKIGADGELYCWWSFNISNPLRVSGWYNIMDDVASQGFQLSLLETLITGVSAGVATNTGAIVLITDEIGEIVIVVNSNSASINSLGLRVFNLERDAGLGNVSLNDTLEETLRDALDTLGDATAEWQKAGAGILEGSVRIGSLTRYTGVVRTIIDNSVSAIGGIVVVAAILGGIKAILDSKKKEKYEGELVGIADTISKLPPSTSVDRLIHTGIVIVSGNTGFTTANKTYSITIQREAVLIIYINTSFVASVVNVEQFGVSTFSIGETISITKSQLGGGTGGNLILSVSFLGTLDTWTQLRGTYIQDKITGIDTKQRRKAGVIGADDIDTTQFTTTDITYTNTTEPDNETITYKQLKSRLNLLPTGTSDIDVYTSTGKIGVGTTPETQIHTYDATNNIMRLGTATNGATSIEFRRGTDVDVYTDWRLISQTGRFELQYENDVVGYGNTGTTIFSTSTSLLNISKDTQIDAKVGIGTTPSTTLNTYHLTDNILRLATGTGATDKTQIQFIKGTLTDTSTDFRLVSELALFKLQYATNTLAFGDTGTDLITARATSFTIHKNTTLSDKVGIGGVNPHATYKVNVGGDVNISSGSFYRINGVQLSYNNLIDKLTAGDNITIDPLTNEISADVPTANNILSNITSGTLAVAYGGTGANSVLANAIPFGNATETAYTYTTNFKYDAPNGRLAVGLATPAYTIDSGGDINIASGSAYRINGTPLSYNDLTNKLTAGTNITITSGAINAIVPAQLTAGTGITITSGAINATTQLTAGTNINITSGVISAIVPAQLTAGTNINITSGVISAIVPAQLTAGTNITITSGAINAIVPAQLTAGTNISIVSGAINAIVPTQFNASAITSGTLPVSRGGTGLGVVSVGVIPFGNSASTAYDWRVLFNWDNTNFRLGVNKTSPAYTIDTGGDINIPTGSVYRINGTALALDNLSGTLPISKGGTGGASIGNGAIPFGNSLQTAYTWANTFKYDITNFRLSLGVATPLYTLDVAGDINTNSVYRVGGNPLAMTNIAGTLNVDKGGTGATTFTSGNILYGNGTGALQNSTNLKFVSGSALGVNIGATSPFTTLHIGSGGLSTPINLFHTYFQAGSTSLIGAFPSSTGICAYFTGSTWITGRYIASSDTRIKKEIEDINDDSALNMILAVEPKTYKYIDTLAKGDRRVYGFIAQQIKEVIPDAVSLERERIPNVMLLASFNNYIIKLPSQPTKVVIQVGDTLKCYDKENKEIEAVVEEVIDNLTFRIKELEEPYTDTEIFIYGTEVKDFHTLAKEYIFTLNVCATQELHRKIVSQEARIKELEEKVERLLNYLTL